VNESGAANSASIAVLPSAPNTSSVTARWLAIDRPKSPCRTCHSQIAYCTGIGRSKP
jgi:hypothetical protein